MLFFIPYFSRQYNNRYYNNFDLDPFMLYLTSVNLKINLYFFEIVQNLTIFVYFRSVWDAKVPIILIFHLYFSFY